MMEMTRRDTTAWTGAAALVKRFTGRHRYERLRPQLARIAAWRHRNDLSALERVFGAATVGVHFYAPHYHNHFDPVRHRRLNVLEIGIGGYDDPNAGGGSLGCGRRTSGRRESSASTLPTNRRIANTAFTRSRGAR